MSPESAKSGRQSAWLPFALPCGVLIYAAAMNFACSRRGAESTTTIGLALSFLLALGFVAVAVRGARTGDPRQWPGSIWPVILALAALAAPAAWVWNKGQLIPDEGTYAFQARQIQAGRLASRSPLEVLPRTDVSRRAVSFIHTIHHDGRWFGKYPPAWPALLALAGKISADWLANVLLGVGLIWATARLASGIAGPGAGWLSAMLMASSPFFFFTMMGRMAHVASGLLLVLAALLCWKAVEDGSAARLFAALACVGAATLVRPYTAVVMGGLIVALTLWAVRGRPAFRSFALASGAAGLLVIGANAAYNIAMTGSPVLTPYSLYFGTSGIPVELRPSAAMIWENVRNRLRWSLMNEIFFTGPVLLFAAWSALRAGDAKVRRIAMALAALAVCLILAHIPTTIPPGGRWGDRFHSEGLFAYVILAAIGIEAACRQLPVNTMRVLIGCFLAVQSVNLAIYYPHYLSMTRPVAHLRAAAASLPASERATIFIAVSKDASTLPAHFNPQAADWESTQKVFAIDPGPQERASVACALDRPDWIVLTWHGDRREVTAEHGAASSCP